MLSESDCVAPETPVESPRGQDSSGFTAVRCLMFATWLKLSELLMASGVVGRGGAV